MTETPRNMAKKIVFNNDTVGLIDLLEQSIIEQQAERQSADSLRLALVAEREHNDESNARQIALVSALEEARRALEPFAVSVAAGLPDDYLDSDLGNGIVVADLRRARTALTAITAALEGK